MYYSIQEYIDDRDKKYGDRKEITETLETHGKDLIHLAMGGKEYLGYPNPPKRRSECVEKMPSGMMKTPHIGVRVTKYPTPTKPREIRARSFFPDPIAQNKFVKNVMTKKEG